MRDGIAELHQYAVAHEPDHPALVAGHSTDAHLIKLQHQLAHSPRTEASRDCCGAVNIDEHHRHLPQLLAGGAQ